MNKKEQVGEIVRANYSTAEVLENYRIDFCCNGSVSLEDACLERGLAVDEILNELKKTLDKADSPNYDMLELDELMHEIKEVHHKYVLSTLPALKTYIAKLVEKHGQSHPELMEIKTLIDQASTELRDHMTKEELILFPYIKAMVDAQRNHFDLSEPHFGDIQNPIRMMASEHENEGDRFKKIAELSNGYSVPPDGCQTYELTYSLLEEFERDLHKHVHLENNILFPKAKALYQSFNYKNSYIK